LEIRLPFPQIIKTELVSAKSIVKVYKRNTTLSN